MEKIEDFQIKTTPYKRKWLESLARRSGVSVDALINNLIDEHLGEIEDAYDTKLRIEALEAGLKD
jgi:predicted DNA-binding protein